MVDAEDLDTEELEEEIEEVTYEVVGAPVTSRVLMKAGTSIVEIESTEELSTIVDTATTLFKQVFYPDHERKSLSTGFGTFERADPDW